MIGRIPFQDEPVARPEMKHAFIERDAGTLPLTENVFASMTYPEAPNSSACCSNRFSSSLSPVSKNELVAVALPFTTLVMT